MSHASAGSAPAHVWRQTSVITLVAVAAFALLRWLPLSQGALHYSDFGAGERGFLEFCEPGSPQFAPVDRVHSPVALEVTPEQLLRAGATTRVLARLMTASGKPIADDDLLVVHTRKLHLLVIDGTQEDYQHIHPEPAEVAGSFVFEFSPRRAGPYRVFADFMPRATGRALYAGAVLTVAGDDEPPTHAAVVAGPDAAVTVDGLRFRLAIAQPPVRINQTATLILTIARAQGGTPELEDVMGAPAHLVAFDAGCTGFAHLHPAPPSVELPLQTDAGRSLAFALHVPDPGRYRLWAQVRVDGREVFAPFDLVVEP